MVAIRAALDRSDAGSRSGNGRSGGGKETVTLEVDTTVERATSASIPHELGEREVHLWRGTVDIPAERTGRLAPLLSAAERRRAERLPTADDRAAYIGRRAWMRLLLSRYLGRDPSAIALETGEHGKPRLVGDARWLRFNLSDSGPVVAAVVARDREVGVDVERVRVDVDIDSVSRRSLTAAQRRELATVPPESRRAAFFATWTRNEAYLKGVGTGLAGGRRHDLDRVPGWSVASFDRGLHIAAAFAVEGTLDSAHVVVRELSI